jgi:hypothetical protein
VEIINIGKNRGIKYMSDSLNIKTLIVILVAGIFLASSTSMPVVNAQPTPTSLTITVSSSQLGTPFWSECTIKATLKDELGNPLPNMGIHFVYLCDDHTHPVGSNTNPLATGTAKTDSNGVASLTHSFLYSEYYDPWRIMANFSGTTSYAPSSSEYVDIFVIDYTPHLVGIGALAVVIISVVGYIVFRRRERAITITN